MIKLPLVEIYSDGACKGNPGPGGWGAVLQYRDKVKHISGYELNTTNNRMEMRAAIEALKSLKYRCHVNLYTDSIYLQQGITDWIYQWQANNWLKSDKKPVKNVDLWQILYTQIQKHKINWHWVKGHATNQGNIMADRLAVDAKNIAIGNSNVVSE